MIRTLLVASFASALLLGAGGCASSGGGTGKSSDTRASHSPPAHDRDDDSDKNDDDSHVLDYGREAVGAEKQAIMAVVTGYYAAEAAPDGSKACALLVPFVAESVVEDYGHTAELRGNSCAKVMSKLFEQQHQLLSGENATLKLYAMRVLGDKALIVLSFAVLPEVRNVTERRIAGKWRMLDLEDGILE